MSWILIIKFIVGASALISLCLNIGIIIYLFKRHMSFRDDVITKVLSSKRFRSQMDIERINILNDVNRNFPKKDELINETLDAIQEIERHNKEEEEKELHHLGGQSIINRKENSAIDEIETTIPIKNTKIYYASAVKESDSSVFNTVGEIPKETSVFELVEINDGVYEFYVYEGAYDLVLQEVAYIKGACSITRLGNSRITTEKKGIANHTSDGKWVIKEQAKVKIE